ncbi:UNVERIFIED_CONTAM: hypothetical protein Sradi_6839300 [Sesamum radiatum]|uniref:Uncharacterized protein n=1 Tax=Sesamum radiatum TaxID=300843 RepID=A0AAW2JP56_SESRA
MMTARGAWAVCGSFMHPLLGNCPTRGGYLNRALEIFPITLSLDDPSSSFSPLHLLALKFSYQVCDFPRLSFFSRVSSFTPSSSLVLAMSFSDESVCYVGESRGDDPSGATSRTLGSPLPSYVAGRRWSLRQAARRLLDESFEREEDIEEKEGSSPGEREPPPREERVSSGNRGSRPEGSAWVAYGLRQSDLYKLVEEFAIPSEYVISLPPADSHPSSPPSGYMSFFVSQLRAGLCFPIPSFFLKVSRNLRVHLNQLVPNTIHLIVSFSLVLRYNNLIPTSELFCQCFQLKRTELVVFHFAPRCGVSFLPTPSTLLSPGIFPASGFMSLLLPYESPIGLRIFVVF